VATSQKRSQDIKLQLKLRNQKNQNLSLLRKSQNLNLLRRNQRKRKSLNLFQLTIS